MFEACNNTKDKPVHDNVWDLGLIFGIYINQYTAHKDKSLMDLFELLGSSVVSDHCMITTIDQ